MTDAKADFIYKVYFKKNKHFQIDTLVDMRGHDKLFDGQKEHIARSVAKNLGYALYPDRVAKVDADLLMANFQGFLHGRETISTDEIIDYLKHYILVKSKP